MKEYYNIPELTKPAKLINWYIERLEIDLKLSNSVSHTPNGIDYNKIKNLLNEYKQTLKLIKNGIKN